jgi:dihydrofolate synthase/folylpolyglutamate synthase
LEYEEALNWLYGVRRFGLKRTLEPTKHLLELLRNPQNKFKSIHVGGTNGKGSTSAMIASILKAQGFKVGLFISPHLEYFNERISINGEYISNNDIARLLTCIKSIFDRMMSYLEPMPLRFFDLVTALAFSYFANQGVDFAVVEVGLGGRLDATNVLSPLVSVITNIGYEHTNILGKTLVEIAGEKAGIIKPNSVLITATDISEVLNVFQVKADELDSKIIHVGKDVTYEILSSSIQGQQFKVSSMDDYHDLYITLLGNHQVMNAATAIATVEALQMNSTKIDKMAIINGLRETKWPARLEVISQQPLVVLDCAKDVEATEAVRLTIEEVFDFDHLFAVVAISSDKKHKGMIRNIAQIADYFILTTHGVMGRSTDPIKLGEYVTQNEKPFETISKPEEALKRALKLANPKDMILVIGSVYLAGRLRKYYARGNEFKFPYEDK